jgi:hypothetical protein
MKTGTLTAALAGVAVAAVLVGGAIAYQRGPRPETGSAAPLAATPSVEKAPVVKVDLASLVVGRAPQVAIIRCAVSSGDCELATPVASDRLLLSAS